MENESENLEVGADETEEISSSAPQDETDGGDLSGEDEIGDSSEEARADQTDREGDMAGEDGGLLGDGEELQEAAGASLDITAEELQEIIYGSIEQYFSTEVINVSVQEKKIDTPLEDLGLTDALLFVLVLVALGHAISEIIGGKLKWRK